MVLLSDRTTNGRAVEDMLAGRRVSDYRAPKIYDQPSDSAFNQPVCSSQTSEEALLRFAACA